MDALSPCDIWATGIPGVNTQSATVTDLLHWNGAKWTLHTSKNVPASLLPGPSVTAVSAGDVWLAGASTSDGGSSTLIAHWNGTALTRVASPNPGAPLGVNELAGISAAGADDIWAAGLYSRYDPTTETSVTLPLAERWNRRRWAQVAAAIPDAGNGPTQYAEFNAVAAVCGCDAWAVGSYEGRFAPGPSYHQLTLAEHWNGRGWQVSPTPSEGEWDKLAAVSAAGKNDVWAVGQYGDPSKTLTEHWNGRAWTIVGSPSPGRVEGKPSGVLLGVATVGPDDAWAVGFYSVSPSIKDRSLVLHWNGKSWRQVAVPHFGPRGYTNVLLAVSASSSGNVIRGRLLLRPRRPADPRAPTALIRRGAIRAAFQSDAGSSMRPSRKQAV